VSGARRTSPWTVGLACAIALLAFAVRIGGALGFAFWQDEVGSAEAMLERTPIDVALHVARFESTPPGFYVLGWFVHGFGVTLEAVRVASAVAGSILAGGVVILARRLMPLWAASIAGLSVALGHQFVFHGRELRSYELHALLCLALAWAALSVMRKPDRPRTLALALVVAVGTMTNYFFLLSLATVLTWCWALPRARAARRQVTVAIGAGLLPFVVWLPAMVKQYGHRGSYTYISSFAPDDVVSTYWHQFARARPETQFAHGAAPWLLFGLMLAGCGALWRQSDSGRLIAMLTTLPVVMTAVIWAAGAHVYTLRNMIGVGPFAAIALCTLLSSLRGRGAALAVVAASASLAYAYVHNERVHPVPYDRIADALLTEGWRPSDVIVLRGNFYSFRSPLAWYLPGHPQLSLGESASGVCNRLFVVAAASSPWYRRVATLPFEDLRKVGTVRVARIEGSPSAELKRLLVSSRLLVTDAAASACARVVPERELIAHVGATRPE
jgi:4-amino-4-deoxy-L-arabinose transferase-like glycosyltransferase